MSESGRSGSGLGLAAPLDRRWSCAGRSQVGDGFRFGIAVAWNVQQTDSVVRAKPAVNECIHGIDRDTSITIDLLIQKIGIAKVRREERQLIGALSSRLH